MVLKGKKIRLSLTVNTLVALAFLLKIQNNALSHKRGLAALQEAGREDPV